MTAAEIVLIILIVILFGIIPIWPHSKPWGRKPSGIVGILILITIIAIYVGGF